MITEELKSALNSAEKAGEIIMDYYSSNFKSYEKEDRTLVTEADIKAQDFIFENLKSYNYGFMGEEGDKKFLNKDRCWVVDPLDGTMEFIKRSNDFAVMIGLIEKGEPVLGVIYAPVKKVFYYALRGKGAFKKEKDKKPKIIKCSDISDINSANIVINGPHLGDDIKSFFEVAKIDRTVPTGSIGLEFTLIAEGKVDMYMTTTDRTCLWDVCAGDIILREAGGLIMDTKGKNIVYSEDSVRNLDGIVSLNGKIYSEVLTFLKRRNN